MRIRKISIGQWRHFRDIEIEIDDEAGLVCVVGANGTGKSHLLELIAACAHRLGLAQGIEIPRGDPFADEHTFALEFFVAPGVSNAVESQFMSLDNIQDWDRMVTIQSRRQDNSSSTVLQAGGVVDNDAAQALGTNIVGCLKSSKDVHFLSLDADRAYPKKNVAIHELAQAYEIDWGTDEYTRGRSFKTSSTLYDEWLKYFFAKENQAGTQLLQDIRRARESDATEPVFSDHFDSYKAAVQKVLPHVTFTGINLESKTLSFDTTGRELTFDQLSGGEREIAFLIGQMDRFRLRQGLFLLDEPELHLNADLIRIWVDYLIGTVEAGQIWLATHSLEAVEAAGQHSTILLERGDDPTRVDSATRLDQRPLLSALARAVGSPAFSLSKLRFIYVEGEEGVGERERYRKLTGSPTDVRFLECGAGTEVIRRVEVIASMSRETDDMVRVGGIVDLDHKSKVGVEDIERETGIFVLPVHEVENFFLHPLTIKVLMANNGIDGISADSVIRAASDATAGTWIFQRAMSNSLARRLPEIKSATRDAAKSKNWQHFAEDLSGTIQIVVSQSAFDPTSARLLTRLMTIMARSYARRRNETTLWTVCNGKETLRHLFPELGFANPRALERAAFSAWESRADLIPEGVNQLRGFVDSLYPMRLGRRRL